MMSNRASGTSGWATVPPGYPNDSYGVGLSSGEQYAVSRSGVTPGGSGERPIEVHIHTPMLLTSEREINDRLLPAIREGINQVQAGR